MKKKIVGFVLSCLLLVISVLAGPVYPDTAFAEEEQSFLSGFLGEWQSDDAAFGMQSQSTMTWRLALNDQFVGLDYRIEMQPGSDQAYTFQGIAYYKIDEGDNFTAFWADNTGDLHPISASREDNALVANWGVEGGNQGRTRYELVAPDLMEVTDWIKTPDGWRQFNFLVFTLVSGGGRPE